MGLIIDYTFRPTPILLYKATRAIFHRQKIAWPFYGFLVGLPVATLLFMVAVGHVNTTGASVLLVCVLLVCVAYALLFVPALYYWLAKKSLLSSPAANQEQHYEISEQGVHNHSNGVEVSIDWEKIVKIQTTKEFLLIYVSGSLAYYIPIDLVSKEEVEQMNTWCERGS